MAARGKIRQKQKPMRGQRVRYVGIGDQRAICVACGRIQKTGMISVYKETRYCSEPCIPADE